MLEVEYDSDDEHLWRLLDALLDQNNPKALVALTRSCQKFFKQSMDFEGDVKQVTDFYDWLNHHLRAA
jgi:hypothetical protein